MTRRPVFLVLLMAMLLQAVSLGGHWMGWGHASDTQHEVLHWSGIAHHHEHQARLSAADRQDFAELAQALGLPVPVPAPETDAAPHAGYHQDQSADSQRHMALDACLGALGPVPTGIASPAVRAECPAPDARPEAPPDDPDLSGPRRPPRSLA